MPSLQLTKRSLADLKFDPSAPARRTQIVWDTKLRGLGIRLTPQGSRFAIVRVWAARQHREHMVSLGPVDRFVDVAQMRDRARRLIALLADLGPGEEPPHRVARAEAKAAAEARRQARQAVQEPAEGFTLARMVKHYLDTEFAPRVAAGQRKARTLADYRKTLERLRPRLESIAIEQFTRSQARALYQELATAKGGRRFVTTNRDFALLGAAMTFALNDSDLGLPPTLPNPFRGWRRHREAPRDQVLDDEQLGRLLVLVDALDDVVLRNYLRLLCSTGQRPGELRRVLWDDVVLDGERPQFAIRCSKNHTDIEVPLAAAEVACFRELATVRRLGSPYVFPSRASAPLLHVKPEPMPRPDRAWRELRTRAELPGVTLHDLKATALTNLARAGFTTEMLMLHGNHKNASTTHRYVRLAQDAQARSKIRDAREAIITQARAAAMQKTAANVTDINQARRAAS